MCGIYFVLYGSDFLSCVCCTRFTIVQTLLGGCEDEERKDIQNAGRSKANTEYIIAIEIVWCIYCEGNIQT